MSEIYKIGQAGCMIYLVGMSVLDIRSRKLPAWLLASGGILAVLISSVSERAFPCTCYFRWGGWNFIFSSQ